MLVMIKVFIYIYILVQYIIFFDQIPEKIVQKAIKIRGPRIDAPENALKGFLKSNNLDKSDVTQENTDKGKFYFANIKPKTVYLSNELPPYTYILEC